MSKSAPAARMPEIDALMAVTERFEAACATDPGMESASIDELLRLVPGKHAVIDGAYLGRPAVFRMYFGPGAEPGHIPAAREWAELQRIWPYMDGPRCRVAEPLYFAQDHGIIVVEKVAGTPLLKHIRQLAPERRAAYLGPASTWLRRYTEPSEGWFAANNSGWITRAERAAAQQPFSILRRLERPILTELHRIGALVEGTEWRVAISHGDFHPDNLLVHGDRLTGIDTGGSARMPIYKDMARFLMHMGRRGVVPSGRRRFGVDAQGINAFTDAFALSEAERQIYLPLMLGCEALLRVETKAIKPDRVTRAAKMYQGLLADLQQVRRA